MFPPADPQVRPAFELEQTLLALLVEQAQARLLTPKSNEPLVLSNFGCSVLDHLDLRSADVVPIGSAAPVGRRVLEEIGRRFLRFVLPVIEDIPRLDARHVVEYIACIDPRDPDPGRLAAAFGTSRMQTFGQDRRLLERAGGYRGRRGDPLADFLIEHVVRPATVFAVSVSTRDF